eukprot:gene7888-16147_t
MFVVKNINISSNKIQPIIPHKLPSLSITSSNNNNNSINNSNINTPCRNIENHIPAFRIASMSSFPPVQEYVERTTKFSLDAVGTHSNHVIRMMCSDSTDNMEHADHIESEGGGEDSIEVEVEVEIQK